MLSALVARVLAQLVTQCSVCRCLIYRDDVLKLNGRLNLFYSPYRNDSCYCHRCAPEVAHLQSKPPRKRV